MTQAAWLATTGSSFDCWPAVVAPVGEWPSEDAGQALLDLLDQLIEREEDTDRRSKLQRLREGIRDLGLSAAGSIIVELLSRLA